MELLHYSATAMFASPVPTILEATRLGKLGPLQSLPIIGIWQNCLCWSLYAASISDSYLFAGNLPGALIALFSILRIHALSSLKDQYTIELLMVIITGLWLIVAYFCLVLFPDNIQDILSVCAVSVCCLYYGFPLATFAQVIKERDAATIHPGLALMSLINATLWLGYGIGIRSIPVIIPNGAGFGLSVIQCLLIVIFRQKKAGKGLPEPVPQQEQVIERL